ncbi:MAG: TOMM system kinase/cyclase fusion protein [Deltaproteobacteria bacterium]|nr:MAG: TOMM system kinase/cyclase fusion protein [Deltaproteobacteria bacterium]
MASDERFPAGTRLQGRYEVLSELGTGSFGRVYKGRQLSTGQDVAIKTLRLWESDSPADVQVQTERFRREMELCASLSHPNIVRLIDAGECDDGRLFVVFHYVPGRTLEQTLADEGPLAPREALHLMTQVLDGITCAHAQGIVHRDLKPANIMLTRTGMRRNAFVLDFGLGGFTHVDVADEQARLTGRREMVGTPAYAAPEQLRGEAPSPLSDLYSWGLIFIECLTGHPAMQGATLGHVVMKQLSSEPVPIPAWFPERRLRRLLQAVTTKDVGRRTITVAGLRESLVSIEHDLSGAAPVADTGVGKREGQRRQLTLVSCRTVAAHTDGSPVDLEDLDHILHTQNALYARITAERGGVVATTMADRLLLVFGYPRAHEHDARHALRAAIRIVRESRAATAGFEAETDLHVDVHIGVHSALVIVRETTETALDAALEIVGSASRIAATLDERAGRGEILVSADTWRLLRDEFTSEPLGTIETPDGSRPLALYRVAEQTTRRTPSLGSAPTGTVLVDRGVERANLFTMWERVTRGRPSTVLLTGESGIGKSRLVRDLRERLPGETWLECQCDPETQTSPLQPIVTLLSQLGDPIEDVLARNHLDREQLPLFADLLSLPLPPGFQPRRLSPERKKELTLAAIVELLMRTAQTQPLVFAMEDLHWADPTTLELLTSLLREVRGAQIVASAEAPRAYVVLTARPEFTPPWPSAFASAMSLDGLDRDSVEALARAELATDAVLPSAVLDHIIARTDGVPLFVEELVRALADRDVVRTFPLETQRWTSDIPGSLRELLTARLDQLSASARDTAQIAAALGREFRYELLAAVSPKTEWSLREDLNELAESDLVYARHAAAADAYIFKHSLVRDAAYDTMVRPARQRVHAQIAAVLQDRFTALTEQQPEILAQHLEAGGDLPRALVWWHRAGDRALRRAAYAEAAQQLEHALEVLQRLPPSNDRGQMEVQLLTTLGTVQFSTRGYSAPEVEQTFARAHAICENLGRVADPKVLSGIIGVHINRGDRAATDALLPQFERLATSGDVVEAVTGLTTLGINDFWRGAHAAARDHLDRACRVYRSDDFQRYAREYGYDGGIFSYAYVGWNLWALGYPVQGEAAHREFMALAETSFDAFSLPLGLAFGIALAHSRRDSATTLALAERLTAVAAEQKLYFWLTVGHFGRGGALTLAGQADEAIAHVRQGLDLAKTIGAMTLYGYYLSFLAGALDQAGKLDEGLEVVDEGLDLCANALARYHEPELLRLRGSLLARRGDAAAAEVSLRRAIELARTRQARAWELRAATTLAALLRREGRQDEGQSLLRPIYGWFTEGFELPDLREARALLVEVG